MNTKKTVKRLPDKAGQHVTAGPYSPVLEVEFDTLVIVSGQAAIDKDGTVVGDTIEEQTRFTLDNCLTQLSRAGCSMDNVFKVNVYLSDLDLWPRFNQVYKTWFADPLPCRTAVQAGLLYTFLVEIEMWAAKKH